MAKGKVRNLELSLKIEPVDQKKAVLPREREEPTSVRITPYRIRNVSGEESIDFRIEFEPDNRERRVQPFREVVESKFPDNWKFGDEWKRDRKYD